MVPAVCGEHTAVSEIRVHKMRVVIKIVVNGMILAAALILAVVTHIETGDAKVIDKHRVVRPGP